MGRRVSKEIREEIISKVQVGESGCRIWQNNTL